MGADLNIVLLHDGMVDKHQHPITASLTLIDLPDIARSARTYGVSTFSVAHSSAAMRKLTRTIKAHWDEGYGSTYNPNRKEALDIARIVASLDDVIAEIDQRTGQLPMLVATSARDGGKRVKFSELREQLKSDTRPYLLMLGTGWGMSEELLQRADMFLEPIHGPTDFNHLSVRSACAIMLDRLVGREITGGI